VLLSESSEDNPYPQPYPQPGNPPYPVPPAPPPTDLPTVTPSLTAVRPTPTLPVSLDSLSIAILAGGRLQLWNQGAVTTLAEIDEKTFLVDISDDGQWIAYDMGGELWAINRDGSDNILLVSAGMLAGIEPAGPIAPASIGWLPGSHVLLFNTDISGDYGRYPAEDLQGANLDTGSWDTLLGPGNGGHFYPSPDGKWIAVARPDEIDLLNFNGGGYTTVLTYTNVGTGSETPFYFYASPVWSADSNYFLVHIPPPDVYYDTSEPASVWRIRVDGSPPEVIARILTGPEVVFSPDFSMVAAFRIDGGVDPTQATNFYHLDGSSQLAASPTGLGFIAWAPDSQHVVLSDGRYAEIGKLEDESISLIEQTDGYLDFRWIDANHYLYRTGQAGEIEMRLGTIGEPSILLFYASGEQLVYDYWW